MPVLLFDIDGTLVRTGGAGKVAMEAALAEGFGVAVRDAVSYAGRTDRAIARDLLVAHGVDPTAANEGRLRDGYLARLPAALAAHRGEVCPGIVELLAVVGAAAGVAVGLLTGNVRRGAALKLGHYGLRHHFRFGGFGDEFYDRDDVARAAVAAIGEPVDPADVWVIGDTPLDVRCARAVGAKAVAVATGWHALDELRATGPDLALADLSDPRPLLAAWGLG